MRRKANATAVTYLQLFPEKGRSSAESWGTQPGPGVLQMGNTFPTSPNSLLLLPSASWFSCWSHFTWTYHFEEGGEK